MIILYPLNAIFVGTNSLDMTNIITTLLCFTPITPVVMIASEAVFGLVASMHEIYAYYIIQLANFPLLFPPQY